MSSLSTPQQSSVVAPLPQARVIVTDVDMTIGSMCLFIIKWTVASIPAVFILAILALFLTFLFGTFFAALVHSSTFGR